MTSEFIFIILIAFCVGFIVILYGIYLAIKSNDTKKWHKTTGVVLKSELEKTSTAAGYDGESQSFKAAIEYRYKVDNQEYTSKRIFYGDKISKPLPFKSKSLVNQYSKNSKIIVNYNPIKPKESVLQKGLKFIVIEILILGMFFIILGFVIIKYEGVIISLFDVA